jgi:hypothetical protein
LENLWAIAADPEWMGILMRASGARPESETAALLLGHGAWDAWSPVAGYPAKAGIQLINKFPKQGGTTSWFCPLCGLF